MPMGTGKTGVMAVLSQYTLGNTVLVVVPFSQLRDQVSAEIDDAFWKKLGVTLSGAKQVIPFTPTQMPGKDKLESGSYVLVCTYQTLEAVMRNDQEGFTSLQRNVRLVLADEGHREPAPSWSIATRRIGRPTILFTATPYRNDYFEFSIDHNYVFRLPYQEAENQRYIRKVSFHEANIGRSPELFVDSLLSYYSDSFLPNKPDFMENPRVIVRCETDAEILHVASLIRSGGYLVAEIHDNFSDAEQEGRFKSVPKPGSTNAVFWVHQNKLIEGVDDPSFCLLAIYGGFRNTRALVQQVGRIIRNPKRLKSQIGYVFSLASDQQKRRWDSFLEYERQLGTRTIEPTPAELSNQVLEFTKTNLIYLDGSFREPFDFAEPHFYNDLAFSRSALVYRIRTEFSFTAFESALKRFAREEGLQILGEAKPTDDAFVFIHYRISGSPYVRDRIVFDVRFGYTIANLDGSLLFLSSTKGIKPDYLSETATMVEPNELERVFSSEATKMSQVSLMNTDLGTYSPRRRTISAGSLAELAPSLGDYSHFCSTAEGVTRNDSGENRRKYVGFTKSRVAQRSAGRVSLEEYIGWTREVASTLQNKKLASDSYFDRFAEPVRAPESAEPVNILLDVENLDETYEIALENGTSTFVWDDRCADIDDGEFSFEVGSHHFSAHINYDYSGKRFIITSSDLQNIIQTDSTGRRRTLLSQLNADQLFRVVTQEGLIYAHDRFYKPRLPLWGRSRNHGIDLMRVLNPRSSLTRTRSEKGREGSANGKRWDDESVFAYIDNLGQQGLLSSDRFVADFLVCDDLGNELADFIALQLSPLRVAFIHAKQAKAGADGTNSASAFHDVCSQAVKNLGPLTPQWEEQLKDVRIWNNQWKGTHKEGAVTKRIRKSKNDVAASAIWSEIRRAVRDPSASREVWLVMGGGVSLSKFDSERKTANPPGHLIQFVYLLQGTWSAVSSIGAVLKVFCSP
jgi:hypothetical protein